MAHAPITSGLPRFDCSVQGSVVRITSYGTTGLTVNPGGDGLGLKGAITVWWNGRKEYEGPVKEITLGKLDQ